MWELAERSSGDGCTGAAEAADALAPGQPRHGEPTFEAAMARVGELENELEACTQRLEVRSKPLLAFLVLCQKRVMLGMMRNAHGSSRARQELVFQGSRPRDAVESMGRLHEEASALLGKQHIVWYRIHQLQIDALHRLASCGEASTHDLVALVRVRMGCCRMLALIADSLVGTRAAVLSHSAGLERARVECDSSRRAAEALSFAAAQCMPSLSTCGWPGLPCRWVSSWLWGSGARVFAVVDGALL